MEQRVLWFVLSKVKAVAWKAPWKTGVDFLKLAGLKGNLKDFILKIFALRKYSNYEINVGNLAITRDVAKVSPFILLFCILNLNTLYLVGEVA